MKYIKYSKFSGDPFAGLSAEDLLEMLQDFLLDSGFYGDSWGFYEMDRERTMEQLHQALLQAMTDKGMISQELLEQLRESAETYQGSQLSELVSKLMERLAEEGYITIDSPPRPGKLTEPQPGQLMGAEGKAKFEITERGLVFLGYKPLKALLPSLGNPASAPHKPGEMPGGVKPPGP